MNYNSFVTQKLYLIIVLALLAGCEFQVDVLEAATPTGFVITSTLPPTLTPAPSETPLTPGFDKAQPESPTPMAPRATPVEGTTSTQVNVRAEPSTASDVLGTILPNTKVRIVGKDPGDNWWLILYEQGVDGKGWVTAQYITTAAKPEVPVIGGEGVSPNGGLTAIIQQQLNVRSGPGTDFNSVGTLNPQDVVTLTGKDANGTWLQIAFASGPEGKGWLSAAFVQANGIETLPIVTSENVVLGTGTPEEPPPASVPTVFPAPLDGDSAASPAVNITLSATGTRSFQYTSDVSSPEGDSEDWIQFATFTQNILVELDCSGSESYVAEILQNDSVTQTLVCGKIILVATSPEAVYSIHIRSSPTGGLQYSRFTLFVTALP